MTTARPTFTLPQKIVAKAVLPLILLTIAAALGSLLGGSTAPAPAHAETISGDVGACIIVCGPVTGGGGNMGSPVLPGVGTGGSGGNVGSGSVEVSPR